MTLTRVADKHILFVMAAAQEYGPALRGAINPLFCGVGPVEAAVTVAGDLQRLQAGGELPDLVVSLGSAGSASCELGAVYQVSAVSWRDIDATKLGFPKGVTPFLDRPPVIELPTPLPGLPTATLSTGARVLSGRDYANLGADMADMETYAVLRACERFGLPMLGLRGISDGRGELSGMEDWTSLLEAIDARLAEAVQALLAHLSVKPTVTS